MTEDEFADELVREMLASRRSEARSWLSEVGPGSERSLGEMPLDEAVALVDDLYASGAATVLVVNINETTPEEAAVYRGRPGQSASELLIELSDDQFSRDRVFYRANQIIEQRGFDPEGDTGQTYLVLPLC